MIWKQRKFEVNRPNQLIKASKLCTAVSAVLLLGACATKTGEVFKTEHNQYELTHIEQLDPRQKADLFEAIILADVASHKEDHLSAMSYYLYAAELSKDERLIQNGIQSARQAGDALGVEQAARIWLAQSPNNSQALQVLLEAQMSLGNLPSAIETLDKLMLEAKTETMQYQLLEQKVVSHDPRVSFNLLRELKQKYSENAAIITAQAKIIYNLSTKNPKRENMLEQSLAQAEQALAVNPLFTPAIRLKSHILYQLRRDLEVVTYLNQLFQQNPESSEISHMLGQLYYDLRNFQASANHYTGWLKERPEDLQARYYQAASYYALGQYHLSLSSFRLLLGANYEPQTVAFYCGDSAQKTGEYNQAISCFKLVTEGDFLITAKIQLAQLLAEHHNVQSALQTLKVAESLEEDDQIKLLGAEISLLNQYDSQDIAKQKLEAALQKYPDNLSLLLKKIELYKLTKSPEKLFELLNQARDLIEPGAKLDRFNLAAAALLRNNGHYQIAIDWLNGAIKKKPDDKDLLYTRALYKESLGLFDEMIVEFKYLLDLFPDDLNIKNALGYTLADTGRELDYAQELIDSAYEGLPGNAAVIDSKGWIAFRRGNLEDAQKYLSQAFKLAPSAEGAAHLGEVLWQTGKQDIAKKVWLKGLELDKQNKILIETLKRLNVKLTENSND